MLDTEGLERSRYFSRQLVGADDLTQDQRYLRAKLRRHNRMLHGWGVVCGLRLSPSEEDCSVAIESGYALDPCGEEIVVPTRVSIDACKETIDGLASPCADTLPWCGEVRAERDPERTYYLAIRYAERATRPVQTLGDGCDCTGDACEYSRISDGFELKVLDELPGSHAKLPTSLDMLQALSCAAGVPRACPDCPEDAWVVLGDLRIGGDRVAVDCFAHRRYVVSFARYAFGCTRGTDATPMTGSFLRVAGAPAGIADEDELRAFREGAAPAPPNASVVVRVPGSGLRSFPARFDVAEGETYGSLIAREGGRTFVADSGESFTLADAFAVAGVDPAAPVGGTAEAIAPLEGRDLRIADLRAVRDALGKVVDDAGLRLLREEHAGAPGRALALPASALMGVAARSPLGRRLAERTIGDVARDDEDAFVAAATGSAGAGRRAAVERQARTVWANAARARRLVDAWERG